MKLHLRPATAADLHVYIWIARAVRDANPKTYIATTDEDDVLAEIRETNVFIIECNDESIRKDAWTDVGYVSYDKQSSTDAYISELAVHPDFKGRGIGTQAFDRLMHLLILEGFSSLSLHTHPENRARKIYESYGFKLADTIPDFLGSGEPRIFMTQNLPEWLESRK